MSRGAAKRVTMRDVAVAAEVSLQTVSNVVNGRSQHMRPETAERVRRVISELRFRPNSIARGLRSARTRTLGFLVLDASARFLGDPMTDLFLAGMGDELRARAHALLIRADEPGRGLDGLIESLVEGRVDGAVFFLAGPPEERRSHVRALAKLDKPFVLLQEHGIRDRRIATVCAQDRAGGRKICEHLIERGHRRIAFITAAQAWSAVEERIAGYQEALEATGLAGDVSLVRHAGEFSPLDAAEAAGALLDSADPPTAFMCANDLVALGVIHSARRRGKAVPGDVAVAGFDDFDFAVAVDPPLTTVRIPGYDMGQHAAATLIDAVEQVRNPRRRSFPVGVVVRASA
jgi:DNA-binding LacI/PurR family transcriptional regulator